MYIHPTAIIDDGAVIGADTKIWHYSHVMKDTIIGNGCILGQNVFVASGVTLGNGVKVQNNVSLYKGVICEDEVFLGPSMVFTNVLNPRAFIERKCEFQTTLVKRGTSIGANATIVCGTTLGEYSFVGAGSVVIKDVKSYEIVAGNPAKHIGWVCKCGLKLIDHEQYLFCNCGLKYSLNMDNNTVEVME